MVAKVARRVREAAARFGPDAVTVAGGGLLSAGMAMVYPPLGYIVGGVLLIVFGLVSDGAR